MRIPVRRTWLDTRQLASELARLEQASLHNEQLSILSVQNSLAALLNAHPNPFVCVKFPLNEGVDKVRKTFGFLVCRFDRRESGESFGSSILDVALEAALQHRCRLLSKRRQLKTKPKRASREPTADGRSRVSSRLCVKTCVVSKSGQGMALVAGPPRSPPRSLECRVGDRRERTAAKTCHQTHNLRAG